MISLIDSFFKFLRSPKFQDIYKLIFGTPQFPFWFFIQAIWECYIIKRSQVFNTNTSSKAIKKAGKRKKADNKIKNKAEIKNSENNDENSNSQNSETNAENNNNNSLNQDTNAKESINEDKETDKFKSSLLSRRKISDIILCYILCFAMNFFQRELFALLFNMPSPIKKNSKLIIFFTIVFVIIFCFPLDIVFKIIHFKPFSFILGILQGANQVRFFKLTLRHAKKLNSKQYVPIVAGFLVFDTFIGFFFGPLFNRQGRRTEVSNGNTICYYILFCIFYLIFTIPNNFSRDFFNGIKLNETYAAFFLVIIFSLYNAINAVQNDHKTCVHKEVKKSKKTKKID